MHSAKTEMHSEVIFNENPRRSLNQEQFATAVGKVMNQPLEKKEELFDRIERNVGGEVSWEEFVVRGVAMEKPPPDMHGSEAGEVMAHRPIACQPMAH